MRIALTADPELPVPPIHYGGIERVVDMLARGLAAEGHEVVLFANRGSTCPVDIAPWPGEVSTSKLDTIRNAAHLARAVLRGKFDLVHSFSRVAYMTPILPLGIPKLMTYQREISRRSIVLGDRLSRGTLWFSAISRWMMRHVEDAGTWRLVYNGVPLEAFTFAPQVAADAPLVFLGRVEEIKGPHLAIEVARRTGLPLVIAGNIPSEHRRWFETHIGPAVDGRTISYVGPVDDRQKNELLGRARAMLMPILWEEPFGIVMAEAMACGAPVIGLRRGAVPEVVEDGVTGFVVDDVDGLVAAVGRLDTISRPACRLRVQRLFSDAAVVASYVDVYSEMLSRRAGATAAPALPVGIGARAHKPRRMP